MINLIDILTLYIYLIICTATDIKTKKISLKICLIFLLLGFLINIFLLKTTVSILLYNLIPGICLLFFSILTKGSIGCGDALILIIMSFYMRFPSILIILFLSLLSASAFSIILIIKKYSRKYSLPFAPFITFGYTIFLLLQ